MTINLLKHVKQNNLILIIFTSMITYNFHESKIIINLTFVSSIIHDQLIHCQIITELNKVSDHKLIKTFFYSDVRTRKEIRHKSWKRTDIKIIKKINNMLWIFRHLNSFAEIKQYAIYFLQFTENLVKKTVSWIKNEKKMISW